MYKVLIVDDEAQDRNIVRILLERKYPDTFQIFEAKNGTQALDIFKAKQIDLLFLDINMPGLSGLNVIRELNTSAYIIVLTAYSFFKYAQEALRYGVKDYLLKPPIRKELYEAVDCFLESQESNSSNPLSQKAMLFQELATQMLFFGNREKIDNYYTLLQLKNPQISLSILRPEQQLSSDQIAAAEKFLLASSVPYATQVFQENLAILFFWNTDQQYAAAQNALIQLQTSLRGALVQESHLQGYQEVPRAFIRLCEREFSPHSIMKTPNFTSKLENAIRNEDLTAAMQCIQEECALWNYQTNSNEIKLYLLSSLSTCTKNLISSYDKQSSYKRLSYLLGTSAKEELMQTVAEYLHWLIREVPKSSHTNYNVVQKAMYLIAQDCSQSWTIDGLATQLHISPYYLSHLFKEQTDTTFTNYLTEYRLSRAIELMRRPELSLSQIGEMVGYTDPNYFSRIFKKKKGAAARDFRKQLLEEIKTI